MIEIVEILILALVTPSDVLGYYLYLLFFQVLLLLSNRGASEGFITNEAGKHSRE